MAKKKPKPRGGRREGAGRPQLFDQPTEIRSLMDAPLLAALDVLAERRGQSRSEAIREAVGRWVEWATQQQVETH